MRDLSNNKMEWLNKKSRIFLSNGYLSKGETPEERIETIAKTAEKYLNKKGYAKKFLEYTEKGWFLFSTPVWANFGKERGFPIACFSSFCEDSMDSILFTAAEIGKMTQKGGGVSGYFGEIRPRGAKISTGGKSDGAVSFMKIYDTIIDTCKQSSVRRGAMGCYLPVNHGDIKEFLNIKHEGSPIQNLFTGVTVKDRWLKSMINGDADKRKTWGAVLRSRSLVGIPYIFFHDNVNKNKPKVYKDKKMQIYGSNLCVAPETLILTKNGHVPIAELENDFIEIWNGKEWSNVKVTKTGTNQKLIKVSLSDGRELECTEYHKWYTVKSYNDQRRGKFTLKRTHELKEGDKLVKFSSPIIDGSENFKYPYTHGVFCGDGTYEATGRARISLYGEKRDLVEHLDIAKNRGMDSSGRVNVILPEDIPKKFEVPLRSSVDTKLKWLAGYLDMDGTVARNGKNESLQVSCVEHEFLKDVQLLLQTLGINAKIVTGAEEGERLMPDGKGGKANFWCRETKRLLINSNQLYQLSLLGFKTFRLKFDIREPQREASQFSRVNSIIDEGRYDDTFCVNEPLEHKAVFNGILTGNCSEITLPTNKDESFVCCLSSMNLLHYDEWKDTDAVEVMSYFLDAVLTEFIQKASGVKFMERAVRFAENHRAIGLGATGYHSLLQSKMIPFESIEAQILNSEIFETINKQSLEASKKAAKEYGEPLLLEGYGERWTTRMAVAPNTSSAFILGQVSQSIEPYKSNYYVKDLAKFKATIKNQFLEKLLEEKGENTEEVWNSILRNNGSVQQLEFLSEREKDVFRTYEEISQREIITQAAQRQKFIDQSQSLNLTIPPSATAKEINELVLYAWESGVKTLYYQHSTNAAQAFYRKLNECSSCEG